MNVYTKETNYSKQFKIMSWDDVARRIHHDHDDYFYSIEAIRDPKTDKKLKSEIKLKELPVFFTATFEGDRQITETAMSTGHMTFDLDYYDPALIGHMRTALMASRIKSAIFMVFKSPSGGLKFLISTDVITDDPRLYALAYDRLSHVINDLIVAGLPEDIKSRFDTSKVNVCDEKCKNINRACYFSIDNDLYYNRRAATFPIMAKVKAAYEEQLKTERETAEIRRQVIADMNREEDTKRRDAYRDKAVSNIKASLFQGQRHSKYWQLAKVILECGGTELDVMIEFMNCQSMGQWTEEMSPKAKAAECYKTFVSKNIEQRRFYSKEDDFQINLNTAIAMIRRDNNIKK
ncbi:BT4734/BF3469 family protein [Aeromonas dhakensis]|uniref:BT4734/BF3469 family protein n=1 Tax=Aeromonas dhakensis TaxID=196024 RepID=UPI002B490211|nr:BT4734/BF3469 family protein [Aeromonas dhakensis]